MSLKTEVYSWRVGRETRGALEEEARREGASVAQLLDRITEQWLSRRRAARAQEEEEQARLRAAALRAVGTISGGDARRSERAKDTVRRRLRERRGS